MKSLNFYHAIINAAERVREWLAENPAHTRIAIIIGIIIIAYSLSRITFLVLRETDARAFLIKSKSIFQLLMLTCLAYAGYKYLIGAYLLTGIAFFSFIVLALCEARITVMMGDNIAIKKLQVILNRNKKEEKNA